MSGSYFFVGFYFGKMWIFLEKRLFFRADMAGLGKYHTGGYGWIVVYRVKAVENRQINVIIHKVLYIIGTRIGSVRCYR